MKKVLIFALCAIGFASCNFFGNSETKMKAQNDSLSYELANRNAELDEIMSAFNEIQEGFREINQAENRVDLSNGAMEGNSVSVKVKEDIQFISDKLKDNRKRIAELEEKLSKSSYQSAQLKKALKNLTKELADKEQQVATLKSELASKNIRIAELDNAVVDLNKSVNDLSEENIRKSKTVEAQDVALNTAWYVFGTKSELKDQKILVGGEVLKDKDFNEDYFTQIDIRVTKEIKLYSKRASLLTSHPEGSYELVKDEKGQYILKIKKPSSFWSISRYLVIQVRI